MERFSHCSWNPFFPRNVSKFLPAFHKLRAAVSKKPADLPLWVFASPFEFKLRVPGMRKEAQGGGHPTPRPGTVCGLGEVSAQGCPLTSASALLPLPNPQTR